jgi:hypothetical protein
MPQREFPTLPPSVDPLVRMAIRRAYEHIYELADLFAAVKVRVPAATLRDNLVNIPHDLTTADEGILFYALDFDHTFRWDGRQWQWGSGEIKPGTMSFAAADPGVGWHILDGATVDRAELDGHGGIETIVLPNAAGCYFKHDTFSATPVVASAPSISGSTAAVSAGTPAGTVSQPSLTMDSYTPAGTVSQPSFSGDAGTTGSNSASHSFQVGAGASITVAEQPHTHSFTPTGTVSQPLFSGSADTLTGTVSQPSFTGSALGTHDHGVGTLAVAATAEPLHLKVPMYTRL